jgi:vacuolar iron transporter family protein
VLGFVVCGTEVAESDPERALETHSREELGVNPQQTGEPKKAAASSFVSFAVGAVIPLLPWFFSGIVPSSMACLRLGCSVDWA